MLNTKTRSARINFAIMWQNISRHRYKMASAYYKAGVYGEALRSQQEAAEAQERMAFYLERLQNDGIQ